MLERSRHSRRRGATLAEYGIVLPVFLLLTFGTLIVGQGMYISNEVASWAREGSRWAAVHGGSWKSENNKSALTTADDVYNNAIKPLAVNVDRSKLSYTVTWLDSGQMPTYTDGSGQVIANKVTVTLQYNWAPKLYLGAMTLTGKSTMTMCY